MSPNRIYTIIKTTRLPFLVLTPACVFLGLSAAIASGINVNYTNFAIVMIGALAAHVGVNSLNEYADYRSGLDEMTTKTPFSGGSGALVEQPQALSGVLLLAIAMLVVVVLTGMYFIYQIGYAIIPLGILGLLIIITYTHWINKHPLLCLISPGVGFGLLMVLGTYFVLSGEFSTQALLVALVPFFLVNNILLLNQFPDIQADRKVGRKHYPIVHGVVKSTRMYGLFVLATAALIITGAMTGLLPALSLIALAPLAAGMKAFFGASAHGEDIAKLMPSLALNVVAAVLTPTFLGIGMILGS